MAKQTKLLTRQDILAMPPVPVGERSCDQPLSQKGQEWVEEFLRGRELLHRELVALIPGYDRTRHDWWRRALEVLRATGYSPEQFNLLSWTDEIRVIRAAAAMKAEQRADAPGAGGNGADDPVLHPDAGNGVGELVLHPDDVKLLQALDNAGSTQTQYALETTCRLTRKTISERLAKLRKAGLTHRPNGEHRGEAITPKGRAKITP